MPVSYMPQVTFDATWTLVESVFANGHWVRDHDSDEFFRRIESAKTQEERFQVTTLDDHTAHVVPLTDQMNVCTTGGLMIDITHGWPAWIETPWGEWMCFGQKWRSRFMWEKEYRQLPFGGQMHWQPPKASWETVWRFLRTLDIDFERSRGFARKDIESNITPSFSNVSVALRSVAGIKLPAYESRNAREAGLCNDKIDTEWIERCAHATPVRYAPLQSHYRQKIALPLEHPARNSEEYRRMRQYNYIPA